MPTMTYTVTGIRNVKYRSLQNAEDGSLDVGGGCRVDDGELVDELVLDGQQAEVEVEAELDRVLRPRAPARV